VEKGDGVVMDDYKTMIRSEEEMEGIKE